MYEWLPESEGPSLVRSCRPQGYREGQLWVVSRQLGKSDLESVLSSGFGPTPAVRRGRGMSVRRVGGQVFTTPNRAGKLEI